MLISILLPPVLLVAVLDNVGANTPATGHLTLVTGKTVSLPVVIVTDVIATLGALNSVSPYRFCFGHFITSHVWRSRDVIPPDGSECSEALN